MTRPPRDRSAPCEVCGIVRMSRPGQVCSACCKANGIFLDALRQWIGMRAIRLTSEERA